MRKFNITVNGNAYQVEVEEVQAFSQAAPQPKAAPQVAPAPAPAPVAQPQAAEQKAEQKAAPVVAPADGKKLESPMPGTIVKLVAANGAAVKKGEPVLILESMKMENEIIAPESGVVTILVQPGQNVNAGDVLAVIA